MISASIVTHKTPKEQLLKAIDCLTKSVVEDIYIIDNSPSDSLQSVVKGIEKVSYFHVENKGYGAGHNLAIVKAIEKKADYHLVMNADVWWEGNVIENLINYLDNNSDVGLIAPKIYYPDGVLQYSCRMLPTPSDLFFKRFLPSGISARKMKKYLLEGHDHNFLLNCPYLLGSFLLFRIRALKECGIFDERFFMYPEDIDISRRLHEKWKTIYYPGVSIVHEHQAASKKNLKMFRIHFFNMIKYFNKWGWWKDNQRYFFNKRLLDSIVKTKGENLEKGRG